MGNEQTKTETENEVIVNKVEYPNGDYYEGKIHSWLIVRRVQKWEKMRLGHLR